VRDGGVYLVEDIHTSHPRQQMYRALKRSGIFDRLSLFRTLKRRRIFDRLGLSRVFNRGAYIGPLHLLLAIEHIKSIGSGMDEETIRELAHDSLFSPADIALIFGRTQTVGMYRRSTLPLRCYCGRTDFDYATLRCRCGAHLYGEEDSMSMSAVLRVSDPRGEPGGGANAKG
jgi:hypothetical protein